MVQQAMGRPPSGGQLRSASPPSPAGSVPRGRRHPAPPQRGGYRCEACFPPLSAPNPGATFPGDAHPRRGRLSAARLEPLQREERWGWTQPGQRVFPLPCRGEGEGEEAESFFILFFFFFQLKFLPSCSPEYQYVKSAAGLWPGRAAGRQGLAREMSGNPGAPSGADRIVRLRWKQ